ncbi:MAG: deoxyribodipyrimidine photolyase [Thermodesulfobacteriota bacterium]
MNTPVPSIRIRTLRPKPLNPGGDFVLYWMIATRRIHYNFSIQHAVDRSMELDKPLVILEALRCGYPWANDRIHQFIIDGMTDTAHALQKYGNVWYYPYLERKKDAGKGLLKAIAATACMVITDDFPAFFLPKMVTSAADQINIRLELVDSNGLLPLRAATQVYPTAYAFRRFLQKTLPDHLLSVPEKDPLERLETPRFRGFSEKILNRWPSALTELQKKNPFSGFRFPIDHRIPGVKQKGGPISAGKTLSNFLENKLGSYIDKRNQPEEDATSGLSPYLHFGHLSAHEIFLNLTEKENWFPHDLSEKSTGSKSGWWGLSPGSEAFLDELITWRELGFNMCAHRMDYDRFESLPGWAKETLFVHETDTRPYLYSYEDLEKAKTHDSLWNAAQIQLLKEGRIHNYLRMLWGKKILEWSHHPKTALEMMIDLNNTYALDGRDPNSYSGIFWCLGRYDRPWGPERPVFGKIRYMSSQNTARKVRVHGYLKRYAAKVNPL